MRELTNVRILWDSDWHDGPVPGLAEYEGGQFWFQAIWDDNSRVGRSEKAFTYSALTNWRDLGKPSTCSVPISTGIVSRGCSTSTASQSGWSEFYDAYPPGTAPTYEDHPVLGHFIASR